MPNNTGPPGGVGHSLWGLSVAATLGNLPATIIAFKQEKRKTENHTLL